MKHDISIRNGEQKKLPKTLMAELFVCKGIYYAKYYDYGGLAAGGKK